MSPDGYGIALFPQHQQLLAASAITPDVARQRNYQSVDTRKRLESIDIPATHRLTPGLLIPVYGPGCREGEASTWQYRPDHPRLDAKGRPVKYVTAMRGMVIDVPPAVRPVIDDPDQPLWITEGIRKADSAVSAGLHCLGVLGVWNWRGTNAKGGTTALAAWEHIALNGREVYLCFDSDVMVKESVRKALLRFSGFLEYRKATVHMVILPDHDDGKTGLDDYLAAGGTIDELHASGAILWPQELPKPGTRFTAPPPAAPPVPPPAPTNLPAVHATFRRWLGVQYDLGALDVMLAAAAVEQLDGDPAWLLLVSGPGAAKTESVMSLTQVTKHVVSAISSEAALLSGVPQFEFASDATGGLLREIGERGLLVVKDFTTILSMNRDRRAEVLAALREVYDGKWARRIGSEGGRVLDWTGRVVLIGAVTTAYDQAHAVIASMGDRFALVRLDSSDATVREAGHRQSLANVGQETQMRAELATAVHALLAHVDPTRCRLDPAVTDLLGRLADLVTLARTAVERDFRGDVIDAHAPEMPTRFAKMLAQLVRGGLAIGLDRDAAVVGAVRVAGDSMPPLRLAILADLLAHPKSTVTEIRKRLDRPRTTVDREAQALHMIGVLTQIDPGDPGDGDLFAGPPDTSWRYRLAGRVDLRILSILVTRNVQPTVHGFKKEQKPEDQQGSEANFSEEKQLVPLPLDIPGDQDQPIEGATHCPACTHLRGRYGAHMSCGDHLPASTAA